MKHLLQIVLILLVVYSNASAQVSIKWINPKPSKQVHRITNGKLSIRLSIEGNIKGAEIDVLVDEKSIYKDTKADPVRLSDYNMIFKEIITIDKRGYVKVVVQVKIRGNIYSSEPLTVLNGETKPKLFTFSIGPTPEDSPNLWTVNDANAFHEAFLMQACGERALYSKVIQYRLTNDKATRKNVKSLLNQIATENSFSSDDVFLFFISSHGNQIDKKVYIQPSDYSADVDIKDFGISMEDHIYSTLDEIDAKKVIFIDACYSGTDINAYQREGYIIITSSEADQVSYSNGKWENGAFTEAIIEGLRDKASKRDKIISVNELFNYVSLRVPKLVSELSASVPQKPTISNPSRIDFPFFVCDKFCSPINAEVGDYYSSVKLFKGDFTMGSSDKKVRRNDEKKTQQKISEDFEIGRYEVTNQQYCDFLNDKQSKPEKYNKWIQLAGSRIKKEKEKFVCEKQYQEHPVTMVTWYGAKEFAMWLSERDCRYDYDLPTEVQWEYAAHGGKRGGGAFKKYSDIEESDIITLKRGATVNVYTTTKANRNYNIKDNPPKGMTANVMEWCRDEYHPYIESNNSTGENPNKAKSVRGGSFKSNPKRDMRIAARNYRLPDVASQDIGFRLIRVEDSKSCQ